MTTRMRGAAAVAAIAAAATVGLPGTASACGPDEYIGAICMTAATFCPRGTAEPNGQILPINGNEALYSLVGTTYGGDGRTSFGLPDLRGRGPVHVGQGPGLSDVLLGMPRGRELSQLTVAELPAHTHGATFSPSGGGPVAIEVSTEPGQTSAPAEGSYLAAPVFGSDAVNAYNAGGSTVALGGVSGGGGGGVVQIGSTGGGAAFSNIPPQLGIRYCIVKIGTYPPRN